MSWSRFLAVFCLCGFVAACGFRPIHAPAPQTDADTGENGFELLRNVFIARIPDREGQQLRNELTRLMHPTGMVANPQYVLSIQLNESTSAFAVRKSTVATRASLRVNGSVVLAKIGAEEELARRLLEKGQVQDEDTFGYTGQVSSISGYNIYSSEFQTLAAEKGARERAVNDLAVQIRTVVASYMLRAQSELKNQ